MVLNESPISGCYEVFPPVFCDQRGSFVKTYHFESFVDSGLNTVWNEEYYTVSCKNVLRGLHFQIPPKDHEKMVYCCHGSVLDVVVDLRISSPTYGNHAVFELTAEKANIIYIPRGLAHGFLTTSQTATMMYKVSTVYSPQQDTGILWSSAGVEWPIKNPIISARDAGFVSFHDFVSPFVYNGHPTQFTDDSSGNQRP